MKKNSQNAFPAVLFIVYLLLLTGVILFKLPFYSATISDGVRVVNVVPLRGSFDENGTLILREIIQNIIIFIPFSLYLCILKNKLPLIKKLFFIFGLSLTFEIIQFIFALGRSDVTDLLANTLGGLAGICIYVVSFEIFKNKAVKVLCISALILTICAVLSFSYLFYRSHFVMQHPPLTLPVHSAPTDAFSPDDAIETFSEVPESGILQTTQRLNDILLVNANNPLPENFQPEHLVNLFEQQDRNFDLAKADIEICQSVFKAMNTMFSAANADGISGLLLPADIVPVRIKRRFLHQLQMDLPPDPVKVNMKQDLLLMWSPWGMKILN